MITISAKPTDRDVELINALASAALPETSPKPQFKWHVTSVSELGIPLVIGLAHTEDGTDYSACLACAYTEGLIRLDGITVDSSSFEAPVSYRMTPMREINILSQIPDLAPARPEPRSQLGAYMDMMDEIFNDTCSDDQELEIPVPKVFDSALAMDEYMSRLAVTLQESILLWMECSGQLAVSMDDDNILAPLLKDSIKRVYMHGAARNALRIELTDGTVKDFLDIPSSIQVEICREVLSIITEL